MVNINRNCSRLPFSLNFLVLIGKNLFTQNFLNRTLIRNWKILSRSSCKIIFLRLLPCSVVECGIVGVFLDERELLHYFPEVLGTFLSALPPKLVIIFLQGWKHRIKEQTKYRQSTHSEGEAEEPDKSDNARGPSSSWRWTRGPKRRWECCSEMSIKTLS